MYEVSTRGCIDIYFIVGDVSGKSENRHPCTVNEIIKCELYLLDALNCDLMVYHPYTILPTYAKSAGILEQKV